MSRGRMKRGGSRGGSPGGSRGGRAARGAWTAGALAALAGCAGPLGPRDSDYGVRVPPERLRQIDALAMEAMARPAGETAATPEETARRRFEGVESVELSLEECRAAVLANNLDLRVALVDPTLAATALSEEEAAFEAAFTTRALWQRTDTPTSSELDDAQAESQLIEPGVRVPLRTGGEVSVSLPVSSRETSNEFATLNPAWTSDLRLSISQPLLRGAGRRANTHAIRVASYNRQVSEAQTKLEAIRQIAAADRAYWRVYQARQELEVRQQQLDLARAQLERAERLFRGGRSAEVELIRAQAGVAERLEAIIVAQNAVLRTQRELKRIVNIPGLELTTPVHLVPRTPPDPVEYQIDAPALAAQALANRMEMLELELRLAADASATDFARNQALPLFALDYSYTINGLGGSLSESTDVMGDNRFEDWSLGLSAEIPLGNEAARARVHRAVLTRLQRLGTREARRQAITQEVYDAVDAIQAGWQRILAARQATILNARTLEAEQRQFELGASTSTDVLDAAARLAESQSAEIRAIVDYQIGQIDLAFATGTLLGAAKVQWDPLDERELEAALPREAAGP